MDGVTTQGAGFPSVVLRFAAHVPLGNFMNSASALYAVVRDHDVLQQAPYNPNILRALHIAEKWGRIAFYWNFALWIPNALAPNLFVLLIAAFDVAIMVHMAFATALQATFIPSTGGACRDAETWQVPDNSTKSFFHMVGTFNGTVTPAKDVCKNYNNEWKYAVASSVIYCLIAASNFLIAMLICICASRQPNTTTFGSYKQTCKTFAEFLFALLLVPILILTFIVVFFFSLLPTSWQVRIRYFGRVSSKATQRGILPIWSKGEEIYQPAMVKLQTLRSRAKSNKENAPNVVPSSHFTRLLNYDVLVLVSQHLHFMDMVNLSLVSKAMRERIFPKGQLLNQTILYKKYTCDDESKMPCWTCGLQICKSCDKVRNVETLYTQALHGESCAPYCEKCYFDKLVSRTGNNPKRACRCRAARKRTAPLGAYRNPEHDRRMCQRCYGLPPEKRIIIRRMHEKVEMRKMKGQSFRCHGCALTVTPTNGPRWWVCMTCNLECRSSVHPPWS